MPVSHAKNRRDDNINPDQDEIPRRRRTMQQNSKSRRDKPVRRHCQKNERMNERNQRAFSVGQDSKFVHNKMTQCP